MRTLRKIGLAVWAAWAGCNSLAGLAQETRTEGAASVMWQSIFAESGRRMEIDRLSVQPEGERVLARGRIVFDRPMPDAVSGTSYRVLEALNRYDCNARTFATLKRVYRKDENSLLREEVPKSQIEMPVRTGTLDDKVLRIACRPNVAGLRQNFDATVQQAREAASEEAATFRKELLRTDLGQPAKARKVAIVQQPEATRPVTKKRKLVAAQPVVAYRPPAPWSYSGAGGPDQWASLSPDYHLCANGNRQSPIDIRETIKVDLTPIEFAYRPSQFRIIDNGRTIQFAVSDNRISLLGKRYELMNVHFHNPSEERIDGKGFDMVAHLVHRADDNKVAIVAVMLEQGVEHPLVQTLWNHLPLEKNEDVYPPGVVVDVNQLLPAKRDHFAFMGSLNEPPCSEGVLWLVMKNPVQISPEQLGIFTKLYRNNARPLQPTFNRLIKESR